MKAINKRGFAFFMAVVLATTTLLSNAGTLLTKAENGSGIQSTTIELKASTLVALKKAELAYTSDNTYAASYDVANDGKINLQDSEKLRKQLVGAEKVEKDSLVLMSPWAFNGSGNSQNSDTYTEKGYQYATLVPSGWVQSGIGNAMADVELSLYSSLRFAIKKTTAAWHQISNGTAAVEDGSSTDWMEYVLKFEENQYWLYVNGVKSAVSLEKDGNLSDLVWLMNTPVYVTELRGTLQTIHKMEVVATCVDASATQLDFHAEEKPNSLASGAYLISKNYGDGSNFTDVKLDAYQQIQFYVRQVKQRATNTIWFESPSFGTTAMGTQWQQFRLEKNADGTWDTYFVGKKVQSSLTIHSLSELQVNSWGDVDYYFSEVFGVLDPVSTEYQAVGSPFGEEGTIVDQNYTYHPIAGVNGAHTYKYVSGVWGNRAFNSQLTLSKYEEVLFYVQKHDVKGTWFQFQIKGEDGNFKDVIVTDQNAWYAVRLVKNSAGTYDVYVNEVKKGTVSDVSDMQYVLGNQTELLYTSALVKRNASVDYVSSDYKVIGNPIAVGEETTAYEPISLLEGAKTYTYTASDWENQKFNAVNFNQYTSILFYLYRVDTNNENHYVQLHNVSNDFDYIADNASTAWHKVELKKLDEGEFAVYVDGTEDKRRISGASDLSIILNASGVTAQYTSLLGIEDPEFGYVSKKYEAVKPAMTTDAVLDMTEAELTTTYEPISKVPEAYTYQKTAYSWQQGYTMNALEMEKYKQILFYFRNAECEETKWFVLKYDTTEILPSADHNWHEVLLKKQEDGSFALYVDGALKEGVKVTDTSKFNMQIDAMKFEYTSFLGIADDSYYLPATDYTVVGDPIAFEGATDSRLNAPVKKITDAKVYDYVVPGWGNYAFADVDWNAYSEVQFYLKKNGLDKDHWIVLKNNKADNPYLSTYDNAWHEIRIVKEQKDSFTVYVDGIKMSDTLAKASDLVATLNANMSFTYTSVVGKTDESVYTILDDKGVMQYSVLWNTDGYAVNLEMKEFLTQEVGENIGYTDAWVATTNIASDTRKAIVLGKDLAEAAGLNTTGLKDNGYRIVAKDNRIYIYGKTEQGMYNGAYGFLEQMIGLKFYTGDCMTSTYEKGQSVAVTISKEGEIVNPVIDYNYDLNGETRKDATYQKRLGFVTDYVALGGDVHGESVFVNSTYFTSLGETNYAGHIPLTKKVAEAAAQWFYDVHVQGNSKTDFRFGLADDANWWDNTEAGQKRTDQYVTFMNDFVAKLSTILTEKEPSRVISLGIMAYKNTVLSPSVVLVSQTNVKMDVVYAPCQANWYKPLTDTVNDNVPVRDNMGESDLFTYDADQEFRYWAEVAKKAGGKIILWSYHACFTNYIAPFECYDAMRENYKLAAELGAYGVIDNVQHNNDVSTDWNRLKVYLKSELAKNPTMSAETYQTLIDNFMNAYFGPAATAMKSAFTAERTIIAGVYQAQQKADNIFGQNYGCGQAAIMYASRGHYEKWGLTRSISGDKRLYTGSLKTDVYSNMQKALEVVADAKTAGTISAEEATAYDKRIRLEMLSIRYVLLAVVQQEDEESADSFSALASDCTASGLTMANEGVAMTEDALKTTLANWK